MTNINPFNIDLDAIRATAETRIELLGDIAQTISTHAKRTMRQLDQGRIFYRRLDARWDNLDAEGRAALPEGVKRLMATAKGSAGLLENLIGCGDKEYKTWGIKDVLEFAQPRVIRTPDTSYTIKAAIKATVTLVELVKGLQKAYDEGNVDGQFNVTASEEPSFQGWYWITFTRELSEDSRYISNRIEESNFAVPAPVAAAAQLAAELTEYDPEDALILAVVQSLAHAEVRFPPPPLPVDQLPPPTPTVP